MNFSSTVGMESTVSLFTASKELLSKTQALKRISDPNAKVCCLYLFSSREAKIRSKFKIVFDFSCFDNLHILIYTFQKLDSFSNAPKAQFYIQFFYLGSQGCNENFFNFAKHSQDPTFEGLFFQTFIFKTNSKLEFLYFVSSAELKS